jgi:hypothetical protein
LPGWTKRYTEGLTYQEVVGVLGEYEWQEQDRRNWSYALSRSGEPFETYNEIRERLEDAMAPAEPIAPERRPWYES